MNFIKKIVEKLKSKKTESIVKEIIAEENISEPIVPENNIQENIEDLYVAKVKHLADVDFGGNFGALFCNCSEGYFITIVKETENQSHFYDIIKNRKLACFPACMYNPDWWQYLENDSFVVDSLTPLKNVFKEFSLDVDAETLNKKEATAILEIIKEKVVEAYKSNKGNTTEA